MPASNEDSDLQILAWDSATFGFTVARLSATVSDGELAGRLAKAKASGVVLAYVISEFERDSLSRELLQEFGGHHADDRLTFGAPVAEIIRVVDAVAIDSAADIARYSSDEADADLIRLARSSGQFSRFKTDPRIDPSVFEAIYDTWIKKSVSGELADVILVSASQGQLTGFVTVRRAADHAQIGLIAVDETSQRSGLGRQLVRSAARWSAETPTKELRVVTQGANAAGRALYERCGLALQGAQRTYHFWLRSPDATTR